MSCVGTTIQSSSLWATGRICSSILLVYAALLIVRYFWNKNDVKTLKNLKKTLKLLNSRVQQYKHEQGAKEQEEKRHRTAEVYAEA